MKALSIILTVILFHTQLASAAGCDLPRFGGARLFGAVNGSTYMSIGDFNQDGFPDLVLGGSYMTAAGRPANGISVLLANGDGTFQPPVYYSLAVSPTDVVVADFNGDGKLDLAVAAGSILVMLGNGDGTFQAGLRSSVSANLMAVGDFNGDGKPDLVLSENVSVLLGKGDGTFQAPLSAASSSAIPFGGIAVGDFNGDGKLDVIAPSVSGGILMMLGDGTGKLAAAVNSSTGETLPGKLTVADLNGDSKLDVVSINPSNNHISVLLGTGNGSFQAATTYTLGGSPSSSFGVVVADLNGDGYPDLAAANISSITATGSTISVFAGNGDGTFAPPVQYNPVAQPIWVMAAGDFNGDGLTDLLFTSSSDNSAAQVGVIFGAANGTFQSPLSYPVGPTPGQPVLADLNGDGFLDMVAPTTGTGGNLAVLLGNGDGSFQPPVSYPAAAGADSVAVGDFNGDGKPDLAVSTLSLTTFTINLLVFLGNGDGTFQAPRATSVFNSAQVVLGDFNKDGKLDAVVAGQVLLGNGDGTFRVTSTIVTAFLLAADLDGDGNLDMVGTGTGGTVLVQLGNGDGTFRAAVRYPIGNSGLLAVGDLNGDGKPDIVAVAEPFIRGSASQVLSGNIAVLLNNGDGTFQPAVKYSVAPGLISVVMADFNGDGYTDVAVASGSASVSGLSVLLGNGDGAFRNALNYGGGTPTRLAVGDLNGDGQPDLALTGGLDNSVTVLLNTYVPGSGGSACPPVPPVGK
jgi:FG-GAP-like repeat/FG-GAP repeat